MPPEWSIEAWCATQNPSHWTSAAVPSSTFAFLERLDCPAVHPFCNEFNDTTYRLHGVPSQGPLIHYDHLESVWDMMITTWALTVPPILAMAELWLRLFALVVAPLGVTHLLTRTILMDRKKQEMNKRTQTRLLVICFLTLASSLVLVTDSLYLLEFGPGLGAGFLVASTVLVAAQSDILYKRSLVSTTLLLAAFVFARGFTSDTVPEGLYHDTTHPTANSIVQHWPAHVRSFTDGTFWFPTGDSRTGLPFLLWKDALPAPSWTRVWLPLDHDGEVVALDICFPPNGYRPDRPVYMVLHGLNGGSQEEYVKDFSHRRVAEESTVVVMIARGLMDLPVRGWNIFLGSRWQDAHAASRALRKAVGQEATLVGVGYSMGAIILSNLVSRVGSDTALSAAVAISGGLDMRQELHYDRAMRLWQPLITPELRDTFVVGKFGERVRARLSKSAFKQLMRAPDVTSVDMSAVVEYNGFRDVEHYYSEMSALGDIPEEEFSHSHYNPSRRILDIAIPFCVIHALDDPLVTWKTVASTYGLRHPSNLTKANSNIFVLLTKSGGHVGWSTGSFPGATKWKWMSDISMSFVSALQKAGVA